MFNGVASALLTANTFNTTDVLDGGDGNDTLNVDLQTSFGGFTTGSVKNIETVSLSNAGTLTRTFDGTGTSADVKEYKLTGAVNLTDLASIATVTAGSRTADLSIAYASKVTDGTADALTLNITDFGKADDPATTATNEEAPVAITVAGVETTTINSTGTSVLNLSAVASKDIVLAGAGSTKVNAFDALTKTVNGSAATGNLTLDLSGATDDVTAGTLVSTGSGNDSVTINASSDLLANATVDGGAGDDTLVISGGAATTQYKQAGFETVSLKTTAGLTMSLKDTSDVTKVVAQNTFDGDATIANTGSVDLAVEFEGANALGTTLTVDNTGAANVSVLKPATDATNVAPSTNSVGGTFTNATTLSLNVADKMDYEGVLTAAKAASVNVAIVGQTSNTAEIVASAATSAVISEVTGADSALKLTTTKVSNLQVSNAKALDLAASTLTGAQTVSSTGVGNITFGDLTAVNTLSIENTGTVAVDALGSATQDYSLTMTTTGAKSVTIGDGAGGDDLVRTQNQNITLSNTGATGNVTYTSAVNAGTGAVNITTGASGNVVHTGAITGKNVTVDNSAVLGTATYTGDINASGDVVFKGVTLQNNIIDNFAGQIVLTGTSQAVSITGGIKNDQVKIIGSADQTSITVTGALDIGTDTLSVDGSAQDTAAQTISIAGVTSYDTGTLLGGDNKDTLIGGSGNDNITGGAGADDLTGGAGDDTIVFADTAANNGKDAINGFTAGGTDDDLNFDAFDIDGTTGNNATATLADADTNTAGTQAYVAATGGANSTAIGGVLGKVAFVDLGANAVADAGLTAAIIGATDKVFAEGTTGGKSVLVIKNGTADLRIAYLTDGTATDDAAVTATAALVGINDFTDLVAADFLV